MSNINITKVKYLKCNESGEDYEVTYDKNGNMDNWWLQAYGVCNRIFNEKHFADWKAKSENGEWGNGPKPIEVSFKKEGKTIKTGSNENLRDASIEANLNIYKFPFNHLNCRGQGHCGTCRIKIEDQSTLNEPTKTEIKKLGQKLLDEKVRLACQCVAQGSVEIETLLPTKKES